MNESEREAIRKTLIETYEKIGRQEDADMARKMPGELEGKDGLVHLMSIALSRAGSDEAEDAKEGGE